MQNITKLINGEIKKIENAIYANWSNASDQSISKLLIHMWVYKKKLPKIGELADKLSLSSSNISKFIKKNNMQKYQIISFIYELNAASDDKEIVIADNYKDIETALQWINDSKRVLLVGTGNSGLIAKSLYTRLALLGINAVFLEGKPDQIRMIANMDKDKDIIICFSFSMSHLWTKNLLASSKRSIYFTAQEIENKHNRIIFKPQLSQTIKYRYVDSETLSYINKQIDILIHRLKTDKLKNDIKK